MKLGKKLLAVLCTVSVLLAMVVIPASAFTGSTAIMPETLAVIDDFEGELVGTGTNEWGTVGTGSAFEKSGDYGYGTSGNSLKVTLASGWTGAKTISGAHPVVNDGLAFWIYLPEAIPSGKTFAINLRLDTASGRFGTKYEAKVDVSTLTAGEHIVTIPWANFELKSGSAKFTDEGICVTQIEFTSNAGSGVYYIDQLSMYKGEAQQSTFVPSTVAMPENYRVIDGFDADNALGWAGTNKAESTFEISADRGYGSAGKSAHVSWTESGWSGFKTVSGQNIALTGDGLAFWAYNAGEELTNFAVVLLQDGVKYETKITLAAGEAVYQIPWADFKKNDVAVDITKTVSQIEFTKSAGSADYYIDEISCYSNYVASILEMPADFTVIDDFNGENTLGWQSTNKATLKISSERGYGADGKGAHVSWSESGWSGMKTASGKNIALTGDGLAFWAYNAGEELTNFAVVLLQDGVKYEAKITLKAGEAIYKIPFTDFAKNGVAVDTTKTLSQIEFTKSAGSADYFIDQIGCYATPKKPEVSTVVFDTSVKSSQSAVTGGGNGATGGQDSVYWKLYDVVNDPRMTRACHFIASDITAGHFSMVNVTNIGTLENADISAAEYFGNLRFWIKSDVANRKLKASLLSKDDVSGKEVEFTVTEAGKWQEVVIPVQSLVDYDVLVNDADWFKTIKCVKFSGQGFDADFTYQEGEVFRIGGVKIYTADPEDFSEYADLDTDPSQPADDGSYNSESEVIGSIDFTMDTYSGNPNFGKAQKVVFDDFATEQKGITLTVGEGIHDVGLATKGLSMWFGADGEANTIDISTLDDGYVSFWVRGSRAGMSFIWFLKDDTDNDAKTTAVVSYTIKEANTWEEVRMPLSEIMMPGMLDTEYVFKAEIRTGYGQFNWRYPYTSEKWLQPGDVLDVAAFNVTEGKPIDPFAVVETGDDDTQNGDNTGSDTGSDTNTGSGTNTGTGSTDGIINDNTAAGSTSPVTGESATALIMLLTFACINGVIAAFVKSRIKAR